MLLLILRDNMDRYSKKKIITKGKAFAVVF